MNKTAVKIIIFLELIIVSSSLIIINLYKNLSIERMGKYSNDSVMQIYDDYERGWGDVDFYYCDYNISKYTVHSEMREQILNKLDKLSQKKIDEHNKEAGGDYPDWAYTYEEYSMMRNTLKVFDSYVKESDSLKETSEYLKFREKMKKLMPKLVKTDDGYYYVKLQRFYSDYKNAPGYIESDDEFFEKLNAEGKFNLYVVDVTTEFECIAKVQKLIIFTTIILSIVMIICSIIIGRKMEQNVMAQRKFFENTSHELKTPLAAIKGYSEGLRKGVITDKQKTGEIIIKQVDKLSKLVEEIMCVAKLESGIMKLHKEEVDASEFIQDCIVPFEGAVKSHNLEVNLELSDVSINIDVDQFEHAFNNLFTNSLKYAKSRISVTNTKKQITIWNDCKEIPDEDISHLFDRFYKGKNGNTGIGLALAKDIIDYHGFKIEAKKENDGICFAISV